MALAPTPATVSSAPYPTSQPTVAALVMPAPQTKPLWQLVAVGLGPLGLLALIPLVVEVVRRLS